jgi:hypothetical protein
MLNNRTLSAQKPKEMEEYTKFDDIRAYHDEEIPAAMQRMAADPMLIPAAKFAFPTLDINTVRAILLQCKTTNDVQKNIMLHAVGSIIKSTINKFTVSGLENVSDGSHLFISNHRDITLDAMLLQYTLFSNGLPTTDIALGDNLLRAPIVVEICRANSMIRVIRKQDVSPREFLENSKHLSEYMRLRIDEGRSVWIAQGNGRTKDGRDTTEPGLVKMVGMGSDGDFVSVYDSLHIAPIAISYEYEPCGVLKAIELCRRRSDTPYQKSENEDFISILSGIKQYKGNTHFAFCRPIKREALEAIGELPRAEQCKALAELIDRHIRSNYHLFATNYIAHDILHGNRAHADHYSAEEEQMFAAHIRMAEATFAEEGVDVDVAREILLGIYANPVDSKENCF